MKKTKNTLITQIPYNYTKYIEFETPNRKSKHKNILTSKNQTIQTIPKSLFDKINVSIMIPNPETTKIVENAMFSAGANVINGKSDNVDIVISESLIQEPEVIFTQNRKHIPPIATVSTITPRSTKSNQLILTPSTNDENNIKREKSPRNILLSQIPWIYENDLKIMNKHLNQSRSSSKSSKSINNSSAKIYSTSGINNSSTSIYGSIDTRSLATKDDLSQNILIISDISRRFRPIYTTIKQKIEFHYGKVPQAYNITPFDPIPPMTEELVAKYKAKLQHKRVSGNLQPANNGYCYICQGAYENAEMHHCSKSHKRNALLENWSEFDQLAIDVNSIFLECTKK